MGRWGNFKDRVGRVVDRIDGWVDKPAKARGTFTQGSEQMVDDDMAREKGRAISNKRSGFGRGI